MDQRRLRRRLRRQRLQLHCCWPHKHKARLTPWILTRARCQFRKIWRMFKTHKIVTITRKRKGWEGEGVPYSYMYLPCIHIMLDARVTQLRIELCNDDDDDAATSQINKLWTSFDAFPSPNCAFVCSPTENNGMNVVFEASLRSWEHGNSFCTYFMFPFQYQIVIKS